MGVSGRPRRRPAVSPGDELGAGAAALVGAVRGVGGRQELFGRPTSLPWGLEIDPAHRPAIYADEAIFHPTFLYELTFNLMLAGALARLGRRGRIRAPGLFALYVAGYSGFRIFEELLRVDPAHHLFGLRLNLFVAATLCAVGLAWFVRSQRGCAGAPKGKEVDDGSPDLDRV